MPEFPTIYEVHQVLIQTPQGVEPLAIDDVPDGAVIRFGDTWLRATKAPLDGSDLVNLDALNSRLLDPTTLEDGSLVFVRSGAFVVLPPPEDMLLNPFCRFNLATGLPYWSEPRVCAGGE